MAISGGDGSIILTTNVDQTGLKKGLGKMNSTVKSSSAKIAKSFAVIGAAAAAATVAITKMAVSAYADYEQLVGGVETLFKGSAQKVIDYANDAFYTAGKNANEFLDLTITFANSLIQGLGGDTERAADLANMAIIDMSDNVNRLGSDVQMVEYAYRGLARQEYRMLDNLKLGYQGTAAEMARLINDSKVMGEGFVATADNVRSISFDKYIEAIHEIQVQLGIAGTTSYEATATIQGSARMMKAAWQNVLSAIAGGGDLDRAINNLVYSIQKYFENIVPVVQRSLVGIGQLIEQVAPMLVQNVASALIQSIPSLINAIYQMIIGLAKGIWQGVKALFTGKSGSVEAQIKTSVGGIADSAFNASTGMTELGEATEKAGKKVKKSLAIFDDLNILTSGNVAGGTDANNISIPTVSGGGIGNVLSETEVASEGFGKIAFFDEMLDALYEISEIFMSGFWKSFQNADFNPIVNSVQNIGESLKEIFLDENIIDSAYNFGESLTENLGKVAGSIASIGVTIGTNLLGGIEKYLKSNSPFIKTTITSIFNSASEIASDIGESSISLANIFSGFSGEEGQKITSDIISIFANARLTTINLASKIGADFIDILSTSITENEGSLKIALDNTLGVIETFLTPVTELINYTFEQIVLLYDLHISPLFSTLSATISQLVGTITEAYNTYIAPVLTQLGEQFKNVVEGKIKPAISKFTSLIGSIINFVKTLWEQWLSPIVNWLIKEFSPVFSEIFAFVGGIFNDFLAVTTGVFGSITEILGGFIDFLTGVFSGDMSATWEGIKKIWSGAVEFFTGVWAGIKSVFSTVANFFGNIFSDAWQKVIDVFSVAGDIFVEIKNGIIETFTIIVNAIIDGINEVVKLPFEGLNKILDKIEDIEIVGIKPFDWLNWRAPVPQIPHLATGSVVPPNKEFLAVLGDNKTEHEIVSPLSTMKQAFTEAMIEMGGNFGGGNTEVVLEIDGREFGRAVVEQGNRENRRIGTRLVIV